MSLTTDGIWKAGLWAPTVWASGLWFEEAGSALIEAGLFAYLSTQTSVSSRVGSRVYPIIIPQHAQDEPTQLPCLVYRNIGVIRQQTTCGTDAVIQADMQIECQARSYLEARELARAVRRVLVDFGGTWAAVTVKNVQLTTEFDLLEPEPGLFIVAQIYRIWYAQVQSLN